MDMMEGDDEWSDIENTGTEEEVMFDSAIGVIEDTLMGTGAIVRR